MTREELLTRSIHEFESDIINTTVYDTKVITNPSGYIYLVITNPRKISCAIHYSYHPEESSNLGRKITGPVMVNTREDIKIGSILKYGDSETTKFYFSISDQSSFNDTMKQYHYNGDMIIENYNRFIILDDGEVDNLISINSMQYLLDSFQSMGVAVIPDSISYENSSKPYVVVSIDDSSSTGTYHPVVDISDPTNTIIGENREDVVRVTFNNFTPDKVYQTIAKLYEYSMSKESKFGFTELFSLYDSGKVSSALSNATTLSTTGQCVINYFLTTPSEVTLKRIKTMLYTNTLVD